MLYKTACHLKNCDVINDVKQFATVYQGELNGSVVEGFSRYREVASLSLTCITALCP